MEPDGALQDNSTGRNGTSDDLQAAVGGSVLFNQGAGTFATAVNFAPRIGEGLWQAAGDLNGDGKPDLVVAAFTDDVVVLIHQGLASFANPIAHAVGTNPASVAIGDVNGDGKLDLVTANKYGPVHDRTVLMNQGGGLFGARADYAVGDEPFSVATSDLDGDGRQDLAATISFKGLVTVLLNQGGGVFGVPAPFAAGHEPNTIVAKDINGDDKLDLVFTNDNVAVMLNMSHCQ